MPVVVAVTRDSTNTVNQSGIGKRVRMDSYFVSDSVLWWFRLLSLTLTASLLCWRLTVEGYKYFYYLTNWNWILNFLFFAAALTHRNPSFSPLLNSLFAAVQPISWIVTIVFWALLFDSTKAPVDLFSQSISHSLNLLLPLIDLFLNRIILHLPHILCPIIFSLLYMGTVMVCHLVYGASWPYDFLISVNGGMSGGINIGYTIAFVIGFWVICLLFVGFTFLLIWIREKLGQPCLRKYSEKISLQKEHV